MYNPSRNVTPGDIAFQRFGVSNLTKQQAADLCGVSLRTWRAWEHGEHAMPYSAWCWFKTVTEGIPLDREWQGWRFFKGKLWSPENNGFKPGEIRALPLLHQTIAAFRNRETAPQRQAKSDEIYINRQVTRGQLRILSQSLATFITEMKGSSDPVLRQLIEPVHTMAVNVAQLEFTTQQATEVFT